MAEVSADGRTDRHSAAWRQSRHNYATGVSWLSVYFQNRFARPCSGAVTLTPELSCLGAVTVPIECPGGASVVAHVPYPVDTRFQGAPMVFRVTAHVKYPHWRGREVRFNKGTRVHNVKPRSGFLDHLVILHFVPWLFVVSAIEDRVSPQCLRLTLPIGTDPTRAAPQPWVEILWLPGPETAPNPSVAAREVFQPIGRTDGWGGRNVEVSATLTRRPADEKDAAA